MNWRNKYQLWKTVRVWSTVPGKVPQLSTREVLSQRKRQDRKVLSKYRALYHETALEIQTLSIIRKHNWQLKTLIRKKKKTSPKKTESKQEIARKLNLFQWLNLLGICFYFVTIWFGHWFSSVCLSQTACKMNKKTCKRKITQNEKNYHCIGCNCIMHLNLLVLACQT